MAELDDDALCKIVDALVKSAEDYRDERSADRLKAMAYYDGDAKALQKYIPSEEGRSSVVSRDVRASVKKVLPSLYRTILGNDQIVEYQPIGNGDEGMAEQATDFVNFIALPECGGRIAIEDAIHDAVRLRNGIVKWWQEKSVDVKTSLHTGLDEAAFVQLVSGDDVQVLEHTRREELVDGPQGPQATPVHDVRIRRRIETARPRLAAITPEAWLIHPDAIRLEDSPILGEKTRERRSDIVRMGYDREQVWAAPSSGRSTDEAAEERSRRRNLEEDEDAPQKALEEVDFYDILVRVDRDGDGIAELRRMVFAGSISPLHLLEDTEWDEINYASVLSERRPHQWEGTSVADDVEEIQRVKTVLLRQTLDNLYWQNAQQPVVQEGAIVNPEAVLNPEFGKPIRVSAGVDVRQAVGYNLVPMVADKSFSMLEYVDREATERTGISDASSGMAPDALQNMTAKASAMVEAAGVGQTEMMVRCIADSLKPVFRGLLRLIIQHQDKPRTVRLRDEWVTFDPRIWNADMDVVVNVGLGAGTRERDMMAMQQVISLQKEILASMGPQVGTQYVTPDNLYHSVSKLVEAAGLKSVGSYFTKPDPQAIQQAMAQKQPNPEETKAQAAMQLEDKRTQGKVQVEQVRAQAKQQELVAKMQAEASKEREQRDADLSTNLAEMDRQAAIDGQRIEADLAKAGMDQQTEREWMAVQLDLQRQKLEADAQRAAVQEAGRNLDRQRQPDGNRTGRQG
ncbi:phage portal protein [Xanthobacteraceae bacterium A53D]